MKTTKIVSAVALALSVSAVSHAETYVLHGKTDGYGSFFASGDRVRVTLDIPSYVNEEVVQAGINYHLETSQMDVGIAVEVIREDRGEKWEATNVVMERYTHDQPTVEMVGNVYPYLRSENWSFVTNDIEERRYSVNMHIKQYPYNDVDTGLFDWSVPHSLIDLGEFNVTDDPNSDGIELLVSGPGGILFVARIDRIEEINTSCP